MLRWRTFSRCAAQWLPKYGSQIVQSKAGLLDRAAMDETGDRLVLTLQHCSAGNSLRTAAIDTKKDRTCI
jgi:hypothetical protein